MSKDWPRPERTRAVLRSAGYGPPRFTVHVYQRTICFLDRYEFVFECTETGATRVWGNWVEPKARPRGLN